MEEVALPRGSELSNDLNSNIVKMFQKYFVRDAGEVNRAHILSLRDRDRIRNNKHSPDRDDISKTLF